MTFWVSFVKTPSKFTSLESQQDFINTFEIDQVLLHTSDFPQLPQGKKLIEMDVSCKILFEPIIKRCYKWIDKTVIPDIMLGS